ncbi:hypothetical protein LTR53_000528 [Teratosphaeriaceae sp. CCFEE 6253]|nr:hypothetical protein LTR53_000528 [Teratosphaeriaceae sp. CCFEE 6253]
MAYSYPQYHNPFMDPYKSYAGVFNAPAVYNSEIQQQDPLLASGAMPQPFDLSLDQHGAPETSSTELPYYTNLSSDSPSFLASSAKAQLPLDIEYPQPPTHGAPPPAVNVPYNFFDFNVPLYQYALPAAQSGVTNTTSDDDVQVPTENNTTRKMRGYSADHEPMFGPEIAAQDDVKLFAGKMSAIELVSFYPNYTLWPNVILRRLGNGWPNKVIAAAQLHYHGKLNKDNLKKRWWALRQQKSKAHKIVAGLSSPSGRSQEVMVLDIYDAASYVPRHKARSLVAMSLVELAKGVTHWPGPADQGFLSKAIQLAQKFNVTAWTTDHVPALATAHPEWTMPADSHRLDWDERGHDRMIETLDAAGW